MWREGKNKSRRDFRYCCHFTSSMFEFDIEFMLQQTLQNIDTLTESMEGKDQTVARCFARGKALNVTDEYCDEAFQLLSRCVKLNPQQADGWLELGKCYWKKGEVDAAINCFRSAIRIDASHKESLKCLSIALRSQQSDKEFAQKLAESLKLAKEAVEADLSDGSCWTILANTYLTAYCFSPNQDVSLLKQCRSAFSRAAQDVVEASQPDFMYNYANLLQLEEDYADAIRLLRKAASLDKRWAEPQHRLQSISDSLHEINHMVRKKSSLKSKRLDAYAQELKTNTKLRGPFTSGNAVHQRMIRELTDGANRETFIIVTVIGVVCKQMSVSVNICVVDQEINCAAVTIQNMGKEPHIGDSFLIPDPVFRHIVVNDDDLQIDYPCIRVDNPLTLYLNGTKVTPGLLAKPRIESSARP